MTRLAGQVALVTHAACGIGAAVARRLAAEGARVIVSHPASDAQGAARVVADIVWRGGEAIAVAGDIAHWPDVRRLVEETAATFGRLDILVNDARAAAAPQPVPAADPGREDAGLFAAMLLCQEALRLFGAQGAIINLTPPARCNLSPDVAPDTALDALTLGLARALQRCGIRVHAIAAGAPGMSGIEVTDGSARSRQFMALPRTAPDAIARLAADLACEARGHSPWTDPRAGGRLGAGPLSTTAHGCS